MQDEICAILERFCPGVKHVGYTVVGNNKGIVRFERAEREFSLSQLNAALHKLDTRIDVVIESGVPKQTFRITFPINKVEEAGSGTSTTAFYPQGTQPQLRERKQARLTDPSDGEEERTVRVTPTSPSSGDQGGLASTIFFCLGVCVVVVITCLASGTAPLSSP
jgi:hypothetical protein